MGSVVSTVDSKVQHNDIFAKYFYHAFLLTDFVSFPTPPTANSNMAKDFWLPPGTPDLNSGANPITF